MSAIYILDHLGRTLISKNYREKVPSDVVDKFILLLNEAEESHRITPILSFSGYYYFYIRVSDIYLLIVENRDVNLATTFLLLNRVLFVLENHFKDVREEIVKNNFATIYELLDEMIDFGYPQFTESSVLGDYVTHKRHRIDIRRLSTMRNTTDWRLEGIKYRKNKVFLDIIESINLLINSDGRILDSEILGSIQVKSYLSGMPELKLGLNEDITFNSTGDSLDKSNYTEIEDIKFHQCVRLPHLEIEKSISFVPPDGNFELMSYRLNGEISPLILAECMVYLYSKTRMELMIKLQTRFRDNLKANNIVIEIPVSEDATDPRFNTINGSAIYLPESAVVAWKIKQLCAGKETHLQIQYNIPSIRSKESEVSRPLSLHFEIPGFIVSGIQVRYLKVVEKSGYTALTWIRYLTQNGDYFIRLPEPIVKSDS
jgi:AP-1 complex subunit mu